MIDNELKCNGCGKTPKPTNRKSMMKNIHIIGMGHTPFRKHEEDLEALIKLAVKETLDDAQVNATDIDEIFIGHFNAGLSEQNFISSLVLQSDEAFRFKSVHRLENACASGSAAVHAGVKTISSGQANFVLVIGAEKMTECPDVGKALARASYLKEESRFGSFADVFAHVTDQYFERFGNQEDGLALIAEKNHTNGLKNPKAHLQKPFTYEFCRTPSEKNPIVAGKLKRTDCSPVSDGAAAILLTSEEFILQNRPSVRFKSISHVNDYLPMSQRDMSKLEGCEVAWKRALNQAGMNLRNLDFVETHDCFTIAELMQYEAMGLTAYGEGVRALKEGWTQPDGFLPVNLSGGLKAKGHPVGATGVSMHVMAAMQLMGRAGEMQLSKCRYGGIYNMGGSGVASYVSILESC